MCCQWVHCPLTTRSAASTQEIMLSCCLRALSTNIAAPVFRRRQNTTMGELANHVATAVPAPTAPPDSKPLPPESLWPEHSPPKHPLPESLLPCFSPIPSPPPAKRTRKAVKRHCEAELLGLRDQGEDTLLLSPLHGLPPPPALSPHPLPITTPMSRTPPTLSPSEQGPFTLICATPELPSPTAAPTDCSTPLPATLVPQPAPEVADPAQCPATTDRPPSLPSWPESYVFSTDPEVIVCHKCCKCHYSFRRYSHCFRCHMNENRT